MITDASEYLAFLQDMQESGSNVYTRLPSDEPRFIINADTREITIPTEFSFLAVQHDHGAETVYFEIDRYFDNVDLSTQVCVVQFINKDIKTKEINEGHFRVKEMDVESVEDKIIFGWTIENKATHFVGDILFSIKFYSLNEDEKFLYNFNTLTAASIIKDTLEVYDMADYAYPTEFEIWVSEARRIERLIEAMRVEVSNNTEIVLENTEVVIEKSELVSTNTEIVSANTALVIENSELVQRLAEKVANSEVGVVESRVTALEENLVVATNDEMVSYLGL